MLSVKRTLIKLDPLTPRTDTTDKVPPLFLSVNIVLHGLICFTALCSVTLIFFSSFMLNHFNDTNWAIEPLIVLHVFS